MRIWANTFCLLTPGVTLIGSVLRVLQYRSEAKDGGFGKEGVKDEQLQTLAEITAEFLAEICVQIPKVITYLLTFPFWMRLFYWAC